MNIGDVATRSGLPAKTIRYYEDIGLIKPRRSENGYRHFAESDLHKLAFLGRARALGFTIEDCRTLMALYEDESRASADVKQLAQEHLDKIRSSLPMRPLPKRGVMPPTTLKWRALQGLTSPSFRATPTI